jgi:colicin import membrane protein/protein TonB
VTSPPVQSALSRENRLWPAVSASVVAHVLLVVWALVRTPPPAIDLEQKPIVAKLVRLGPKRPEQWLPRKEADPPPATAPAAPPAPPTAAAPALPAAPSPRAKPAPARAAAPSPTAVPVGPAKPGASLSSILSKVQRQHDDQRWGDPNGDPAGDSDTGEGDQYLAQIDRALHANYVAPSTIPERERLYLQSRVILWIEPDGRVTRWRQERSSGNPTFDAAVEKTLKLTARVTPPPERLRDLYRRDGIALIFQAR